MPNWISQKISSVPNNTTAVAIAVEADLQGIEGLGKLASADGDFVSDLKFFGTNWFYLSDSARRVLVALVEKQTIKDIRGLAEKVASALQAKKIKDVEFVFSSSITNIDELAGHFINNFLNKNYESDCKRPLEEVKG